MSAFVAEALSTSTVPPEVKAALTQARQETLLCNLRALRAQVELAKLLQEHELPFSILKGTPLAVQAYGSLALRQSRDIDLLVRGSDLAAVGTLMRSLGYERSGLGVDLTGAQEALWLRSHSHFEYVRRSDNSHVEVHWRLTHNRHLLDFGDAPQGREMVGVAAGVTLPALPARWLLLHLCVHGAGHAWFRLKWLADVAALLHAAGEPGRRELLKLAEVHALERPVLQAFHLCHALFGVPLDVCPSRPSLAVRTMLHIAARALLREDIAAPTPHSDFVPKHLAISHLLLRRDWRYRMHELALQLHAPSDWKRLNLAPHLHWLYPMLRLPLWCRRRWFAQ